MHPPFRLGRPQPLAVEEIGEPATDDIGVDELDRAEDHRQ